MADDKDSDSAKSKGADSCAENGTWTSAPKPPSKLQPLDFATIDPAENARVATAGSMTFMMTGCSGDPDTPTHTRAVAAAMVGAGGAAFFYHLGDVTYVPDKGSGGTDDERTLWNDQFYAAYTSFPKQIVSIAGNHDGKLSSHHKTSQLTNYMANFCADASAWPHPWKHNSTDKRPAMIQPFVYWRFETPLAHFIGLYTNVVNGGMLDEPAPHADFRAGAQYKWLVGELSAVKAANAQSTSKKAVLLALHYPPYSGAANFDVRGDQSKGPTPHAKHAPYLAVALQQAFAAAGQRPDVIFSAHAHLFQRLSYHYADGTVVPCLIVGCGGHSPLEDLSEPCAGGKGVQRPAPFPAVVPGTFAFPKGESAVVEYYEDGISGGMFGFLQVTIEARTLSARFVDTSRTVRDGFVLDLDSHTYRATPVA